MFCEGFLPCLCHWLSLPCACSEQLDAQCSNAQVERCGAPSPVWFSSPLLATNRGESASVCEQDFTHGGENACEPRSALELGMVETADVFVLDPLCDAKLTATSCY